jgi:signal transduction histidine kinase
VTIRARTALWYSGVLLISILLVAGLCVHELYEYKHGEEKAEESWDDVLRAAVWIAIPTIVLSAGGGWWLMRRAMAPVAALTRAAEGITEKNLDQPLPRAGNGDELDRLTEVFNAMTARLHNSFTRVRDFTLHASHELKTPLTVLCGETETELQDETLTPQQRERSASRLDELRRLSRIVDALTLLAKADAGLISLARAPVAFDALVQDSFADTQVLAQASAIRVSLEPCEKALVPGDPHRLRQLLLNLADNAVKYNHPGGHISMALRRSSGAAEFSISNSGPGIPAESLPKVFDRFFRGDSAHNNEIEGCGLGLSLAQWIVSAHNGTIKIESEPGKLTTVKLRLPISEQAQSA